MIALVVDSNSQITPALQQRFAVHVVPLTVVVDGVELLEGSGIDAAGITAALLRGAAVSTATPSPGQFLAAYQQAAQQGATEVLSVHTGGAASGTANSARLAARLSPIAVEVVDTATASFPVALCAWSAGEVLAAGGTVAAAAAAARATAAVVDNVFIVGTLALAARGGRLAPAAQAAGPGPAGQQVPQIPVLAFTGGVMQPVGRVGRLTDAVQAMVDYVAQRGAGRPLRLAVGDLAAPELAQALEGALRDRVQVAELVRYQIGPSVAVHTGLGTVGCVFHAM